MGDNEYVSKGKLRLSASGKCARALAYDFHGLTVEGKEMDARAKIIFWMGDLVEMMVISLAKLAGCPITATGLAQAKVGLPIGDIVIPGHLDGLYMGIGEIILVEVKSMSSYAYEKFEKGIVDDGYMAQFNSYMKAAGLKKVVIVAINKESGVMHELMFELNDGILALIENNFKEVLKSTPDNLPQRPYKPDAKGMWGWKCDYCKAYKTCLIDSGLAVQVLKSGAYKLKVPDKKAA